MTEVLENPMLSVVPNLVTCINNRINAEKFENKELLAGLQLFLEYAAASPQPTPPQLPDVIMLASQQFNMPISREAAYDVAKQVADLILAKHLEEVKND